MKYEKIKYAKNSLKRRNVWEKEKDWNKKGILSKTISSIRHYTYYIQAMRKEYLFYLYILL